MNEKRKARIIIECLDEVQSGRMSREECKQKYPGLAEELQSVFYSSEILSSMQFPEIDPLYIRKQKIKLMQKIPDRENLVTKSQSHRYIKQKYKPNLKRRFDMTWVVIVATILSLVSGAGAVYASKDALPGDVLYPVKTWIEDFQETINFDDFIDTFEDYFDGLDDNVDFESDDGIYDEIDNDIDDDSGDDEIDNGSDDDLDTDTDEDSDDDSDEDSDDGSDEDSDDDSDEDSDDDSDEDSDDDSDEDSDDDSDNDSGSDSDDDSGGNSDSDSDSGSDDDSGGNSDSDSDSGSDNDDDDDDGDDD